MNGFRSRLVLIPDERAPLTWPNAQRTYQNYNSFHNSYAGSDCRDSVFYVSNKLYYRALAESLEQEKCIFEWVRVDNYWIFKKLKWFKFFLYTVVIKIA